LALPVRIGIPNGVGGLIDDVITPAFSVCVGLILFGVKMGPKENLNSFSKKFKLPSIGIASKLLDAIKNLLP
jgi:cell division ATPase FtsA